MPNILNFVTKYLNPIYHALIMMRGVWLEGKSLFDFPKEAILIFILSIIFLAISNTIDKKREE